MGYISTTFTGTPAECIEHFDKVCASYHPSGYGTRIDRLSSPGTPSSAFDGRGSKLWLLNQLVENNALPKVTITIGRYDSAD